MRDAAELVRQRAQLFDMDPSRGDAPSLTFTSFRKVGCEPALPSLGGYAYGYEAGLNGGPAVRERGGSSRRPTARWP